MSDRITLLASVVLAGALQLASQAAAAQQEKFGAGALSRIEIDLPATDKLELRGLGEGAVVRVDNQDRTECRVELKRDGSVLRVRYVAEPTREYLDECDLKVRVDAAADIEIDVELGAGNVDIRDLASALELEVGAGNVSGTGTTIGSVTTGAGNISLRGLEHPLEVKTGAGNITLEIASAPKGTISAHTGVGSIDVRVPKGAPVHTRLSSGLGSVDQGVTSQPGAPTRVEAFTGMGSIRLGSS